ncbi:MAG: cellulose biosynthesis cyclic di-GMP-binding regulatory protein BcsB, partial [Tateyamaria sp.]
MRMIGIGLTGFLLAAVAFLLSNLNILEQGQTLVRNVAFGQQMVFEHRATSHETHGEDAVVLRATPDHPVILSGFPAYQSIAFTFPKDARPTSGYLQINATSQVLAGVEGVLRISIHGTRRGDLLLRPGEAGRSLQIPLSPTDFAGDQLVVSFSLQGTDPQQQCGPEDGISAIVEIETTSALHLKLDQPLTSARDRFHAWGDVIRVSWPTWLKRDEQERRLVLAALAKQKGLRTQFLTTGVDEAPSTEDLRNAVSVLADMPGSTSEDWMTLAQVGANAGLRRFHRTTTWRTRYALIDGAGQSVPSHIDLRMVFGDLLGADRWLLTVTLNNRLVVQASFHGGQHDYRARVALHASWQGARNQIEIIATTTEPRDGLCDDGPELLAEMLPDTQLVSGAEIYAGPVAALHADLSKLDAVHVSSATSLTPPEADRMAGWLASVSPAPSTLKPAATHAHIVVAGPDTPLSTAVRSQAQWIVTAG